MSNKPEKMDDIKLNAFIDNELRQTIGFGQAGDEISSERARNLEYYLNRPLGDEEDGKSKLQSSDVQDVVETFLPALLAPFISSDETVEFKPVSKEDEEYAEQAGKYINHIFMVDNDGVKIQYTWAKDGLISKNGFLYIDWCEKERTALKYQRVSFAGLATLQQDPEIEILEFLAIDALGRKMEPEDSEAILNVMDPSALDGVQFEVKFRRTWMEGRVKVENIPPEFVIVSKTAKDCETARMIGWQEQVSLSTLREEGYPESKLETINFGDDEDYDPNGESLVRKQAQGGLNDSDDNATDPASRLIWRTVAWMRVDYDGDGKAELRKIVRAGTRETGGVILLNEEADEPLIVSFTPIPMPHQLFGRALADLAIQIQDGKTSMLRMGMDATYHTVHPRWAYSEELANENTWDDLMMDIPGAPVRMDGIDAVRPLRDSPNIEAAYQMLEYLDRVREIRTPVSRQDTGVDADALNDTSATQAQIQANASAMRKELILRVYSESLSKVFRLINRLVIKYQDKPRLLRLYPDKDPVEVDPRFWNADMDVSVRVGLGTGTKDQQLQSLMTIHQIQMGDLQLGLPTVDVEKLYATRSRLVEFSGLSTPELYFNDPKNEEQQGQAPAAPSPEETQQAEIQKQQEAEQIQQAIEQAREAGKQEGMDIAKIEAERIKAEAQVAAKQYEVDANERTKIAEIQARSADSDRMKQVAEKPATVVQFDAQGKLDEVAQNIQQMAAMNMQNNAQISEAMIAVAQSMQQLAAVNAAPKVGTLPGGRTVTIQPMLAGND